MNALFVALGIMVLALLALLLWFVPHILQQQSRRVSDETAQLREMLLDLLQEQETVAVRQWQLNDALNSLQIRLETLVDYGPGNPQNAGALNQQLLDTRIGELKGQISEWLTVYQQNAQSRSRQDNESWGYLMSLLAAIQERLGTLAHANAADNAEARASVMLEDLEREMNNLRTISEDIGRLQQRLRRTLTTHEPGVTSLRNGLATPVEPVLRVS